MSQIFPSGGQSIGASASATVLPKSIPLRLTGLISLLSKGFFKILLQHHSLKASILWCSAFFTVQLSHTYMTSEKTTALTIWTFVSKVMPLLFNTLSRFVIAFLPRSNYLLISWLQSPSTVILESRKSKSVTASTFSLSNFHEVMRLATMILSEWVKIIQLDLTLCNSMDCSPPGPSVHGIL